MSATVLILGSGGQLGQELLRTAWPDGAQAVGKTEAELDITNQSAVVSTLQAAKATGTVIVINAAAYTAVDKAESEPALAFAVNKGGAANVAEGCAEMGLPLIHISTDYVFDGMTEEAYVETDIPHPLGVYGQSKLEGERAVQAALQQHIILRSSWIYSAFGHNFVKTMLRLARERPEIRVVNDQWGCPTSARDLAAAISAIAPILVTRAAPWGLYHCASQDVVSWYDVALATVESSAYASRCRVLPIPTSEYPTAALRPPRSALDSSHFQDTFGIRFPPWRESVKRVVAALKD